MVSLHKFLITNKLEKILLQLFLSAAKAKFVEKSKQRWIFLPESFWLWQITLMNLCLNLLFTKIDTVFA